MNLTAQEIVQSMDEQLKMAWQLAATVEMLARLTADQQDNGRERGVDGPGGHGRGQANGGDHAPINGANLRIWINKSCDYFTIFSILDCMWPTAASLHMEDNTAMLLQVYKMKGGLGDWPTFVAAVEVKFGAYDYRKAIQDVLPLKQVRSVEDYTREFEVVQFQVSMFNADSDITFC
jgi:hypothetical protein